MRRDFSIVLAEHGLDLDRALRDVRKQPDYSMAEHARDLAGALRWNAVGAMRRQKRAPARPEQLSAHLGDNPATSWPAGLPRMLSW
jgi:asparagine synthase (glutamine-hydrolysing)